MRCWLTLLLISASTALADTDWNYGKRGLEWSDTTTGSYLWLGLRSQARYTTIEQALRIPSDFDQPTTSGGSINRARYKIGAAYRDDFTFYHEYDLRNSRLLDLRTTWVANPEFNLRLGTDKLRSHGVAHRELMPEVTHDS